MSIIILYFYTFESRELENSVSSILETTAEDGKINKT